MDYRYFLNGNNHKGKEMFSFIVSIMKIVKVNIYEFLLIILLFASPLPITFASISATNRNTSS